MISGNMTVTEFVMLLWENKIKVTLLILAVVFGPSLYEDWKAEELRKTLESDRKAVGTQASIAGMMLVSAWKSCSQIGIGDNNACSKYEGHLLQEQAAPMLAKTAAEQRDSYLKNCQRFYEFDYCRQLLERSIQLSNAQSKE